MVDDLVSRVQWIPFGDLDDLPAIGSRQCRQKKTLFTQSVEKTTVPLLIKVNSQKL